MSTGLFIMPVSCSFLSTGRISLFSACTNIKRASHLQYERFFFIGKAEFIRRFYFIFSTFPPEMRYTLLQRGRTLSLCVITIRVFPLQRVVMFSRTCLSVSKSRAETSLFILVQSNYYIQKSFCQSIKLLVRIFMHAKRRRVMLLCAFCALFI